MNIYVVRRKRKRMSKERPYEFVPTYALAVLMSNYAEYVKQGFFKLQKDLDEMEREWKIRFKKDDRQISIDEYMRSKKHYIPRRGGLGEDD